MRGIKDNYNNRILIPTTEGDLGAPRPSRAAKGRDNTPLCYHLLYLIRADRDTCRAWLPAGAQGRTSHGYRGYLGSRQSLTSPALSTLERLFQRRNEHNTPLKALSIDARMAGWPPCELSGHGSRAPGLPAIKMHGRDEGRRQGGHTSARRGTSTQRGRRACGDA